MVPELFEVLAGHLGFHFQYNSRKLGSLTKEWDHVWNQRRCKMKCYSVSSRKNMIILILRSGSWTRDSRCLWENESALLVYYSVT